VSARAPLHVGLDLVYWVPDAGGAGTYARELIRALHAAEPGTRITAWVGRDAARDLAERDWGGETRFVRLAFASTGSPVHVGYELAALGLDARRRGCDVVHGLAYATPLVAPGVARLVTILDLTWHHHPESVSRPARAMFRLLSTACGRGADRVIAISQTAAADIAATLGLPREKIDVTPLGVAPPPAAATAPARDGAGVRARLGLPPGAPLLLCVAQLAAHKNLRALIDALPDDAWLVIVGRRTAHANELRGHARARGVAGRLVLPGFVADADLEGLYAAARGLVLPSLCEGFGLPLLEAMRRGLPVACANASALPEVAGGAALLFDPRDAVSLRAALARLIGDDPLRARLIVAGHERAAQMTWDATARATLAAYRRALGTA
jgi:glycosyltransferase involved in cell wall biosynthesis